MASLNNENKGRVFFQSHTSDTDKLSKNLSRPCVRIVYLILICWLFDLQELKHFYRDQIFLQRFPSSLAVRKNAKKLLVT